MRKFLIAFLFLPVSALAQIPAGFVQTTATVASLANAQYSAAWTNLSSSSQLPLLGGVSAFPESVVGRMDSNGHMSVLLADTAQIIPTPSTWTFSFIYSCPNNPNPGGFQVAIAVTGGGGTEDVTSQVTAALPSNPCAGGGGGGATPAPPALSVQYSNRTSTSLIADGSTLNAYLESTNNNGISLSAAECETYSYACQILAPALYATTEAQPWGGAYQWSGNATYSNFYQGPAASAPIGTVLDQRFGAPQWITANAELPPSWARNGSNSQVVGAAFASYNTAYTNSSYFQVAPTLTLYGNSYAGTRYDNYQAQFPTLNLVQTNDSPAATYGLSINQYANATGDSVPFQINHFERGGLSTGDSEGAENRTVIQEATDVYRGTVNSITNEPSGATNICGVTCVVFNTTQTQGYAGSLGDELDLIDLTQADTSGYITTINSNEVTCSGCDWDSKYGDSAYTTLTANTSTTCSISSNPLTPPSGCVVNVTSPLGFTPGGNACIFGSAGVSYECEPITAVGTNTVTIATIRKNWSSGNVISEGGMAGMTLSFQADEVGPGYPLSMVTVSGGSGMTTGTYALSFSGGGATGEGAAGSLIVTSSTAAYAILTAYGNGYTSAPTVTASPGGTAPTLTAVLSATSSMGLQGTNPEATPINVIRTAFPIMYNTAGGNLFTPTSNEGHGLQTSAYTQMGSGGTVSSCSIAGGSITGCTVSGGSGYSSATGTAGFILNQPQLQISGLTCTTYPVLYITAVTSGALSGLGVSNAGSGCSGTPIVTVVPANPYAVYPAAKIVNVWNPATGAVDGSSIATGPENGTFNVGDTVEVPHYSVEDYTLNRQFLGGWQADSFNTPYYINLYGKAAANGEGGGSVYLINNLNSPAMYSGYPFGTPWIAGGSAWTGETLDYLEGGGWAAGLRFQTPLYGSGFGGGGAIVTGCTLNGVNLCANWNQYENLLAPYNRLSGGAGQDVLAYNPQTEAWDWTSGASQANGANPQQSAALTTSGFYASNQCLTTQGGWLSCNEENWAPYSLNPGGATWETVGGTAPTITGGQADPWKGTSAYELVFSSSSTAFSDTATSGYTSLTSGTSYSACFYAKGATGTEQVAFGTGSVSTSVKTLGTTWQEYCLSGVVTSLLNYVAAMTVTGPETIYFAGVTVTPTSFSSNPPIPVPTTNNQILTPTLVNNTPTINAGQLTINGVAVSTPTTGYATLASGTVTVSNSAACAASSTCVYSLTNCGTNSSAGIGTLTLGTVTAGTSFVINSVSSANAVVTTDNSHVCWSITP